MDRQTSSEIARQGYLSVQEAEGSRGMEKQRGQIAAIGNPN